MSDSHASALERAKTLIDLGRPEEALQPLGDAMTSSPEDPMARCLHSLALLRMGRLKEADKAAGEAITLAPDWEHPHRLRAIALMESDKKAALRSADEAVRLEPEVPETHLVRAQVLLAMKKLGEARESAERVIALDPEQDRGYSMLGDIAESADRPSEALGWYRKALEIDPEDAMTHNNLGVTLQRLDRKEEAHEAFENAARLDPKMDLARQNLAGSARSSANGWVGMAVTAFFGIRAITEASQGEWAAAAGLGVVFAIALGFTLWSIADRTKTLSPAAQAVIADQKWWEKLELKYWRPWPLLIPSPIYFAIGLIALALVVGGAYHEEWDGSRLAWTAALALFVAFTAWRGRRYLRLRGWWPGTG